MSYNGSGTFVINTAGQPVVSGTVISSTAFNALTADLATGLSTAITKDGQTTPTANIPMGNNKITGLAVGTAATDAANLSQVQSTAAKLVGSVSGVDTITGTMSPTLAAYAAGQMFYFVAAGDNTGAVTLNLDGLGAKSVTRDGSVALAAGDIKSGEVVVVVYDGTRFQVVSQLNSAGNATFANVSITSALNVGGVATFSGGTANGVTYLNGSKALTSGSALVFDGTNLGIGTSSPGTKLQVSGGFLATTGIGVQLVGNSSGANSKIQYTDGVTYNWTAGTTGNAFTISSGEFGSTTGTERLRIDSSGNLGLGVTPSAWLSGAKVFQFGSTSALSDTQARYTDLLSNCYVDTGGNVRYLTTGNATIYSQNRASGIHAWFNAASGTAGNIVSLTQAMTLDASGQLLVGTTSALNWAGVTNGMMQTARAGWNANFFTTFSNNTEYPVVVLGKSRSGTIGTFTYPTSGDTLGILTYAGGDTSSTRFGAGALIGGVASATWTATSFPTYLTFNTTASGSTDCTERARITSGGDLLVGTSTAVNARLQVDSGSSGLYGYFNSTNANGGYVSFASSGTVHGDIGTAAQVISGGTTNFGINARGSRALLFGTNETERARITSGGNFLINNTSATDSKLIVTGGGTTSASYSCIFEDSGGEDLFWARNDGLINTGTKASSPYYYVVGGTNRDLYIDNSGAIGITTSVRASKTNIAPVVDTDWLLQLNPVTFHFRKKDADGNYTDEADGPLKHGLIAEEVEEVNADLCFYDDENKGGALRGVNYSHLVTPMLKLIQKQQAAIAALEAKVAALEAK